MTLMTGTLLEPMQEINNALSALNLHTVEEQTSGAEQQRLNHVHLQQLGLSPLQIQHKTV